MVSSPAQAQGLCVPGKVYYLYGYLDYVEEYVLWEKKLETELREAVWVKVPLGSSRSLLSDWSTTHGIGRLRDHLSKLHIHKYLGPGGVHLGVPEGVGCCNNEVHLSSLKGHGIVGVS